MGGRIQVKSELNKGSCFEVVLPFAIDPNGSQEKMENICISKVKKFPY